MSEKTIKRLNLAPKLSQGTRGWVELLDVATWMFCRGVGLNSSIQMEFWQEQIEEINLDLAKRGEQ